MLTHPGMYQPQVNASKKAMPTWGLWEMTAQAFQRRDVILCEVHQNLLIAVNRATTGLDFGMTMRKKKCRRPMREGWSVL
jgi:hypothetical protein